MVEIVLNPRCVPSPFRPCQEYAAPFLAKDKPVFNVEFIKEYGLCLKSNELSIDTIFKVRTRQTLPEAVWRFIVSTSMCTYVSREDNTYQS